MNRSVSPTPTLSLNETQQWIASKFADLIDANSSDHGLARLLEQSGQLAEALISRGSRSVQKEMVDVLLVLICIANKEGIDLEHAIHHDLMRRDPKHYMATLNLSKQE